MSAIFGPCVQQGYVVPDVDAAMKHWTARGVGPFFLNDIKGFPGTYGDRPIASDMKAGFAYCGDQQIEVIEPTGKDPTIYRDYLKDHPEGGLQHLAYWVDNVDAKLAELRNNKLNFKVCQRYGDAHAYIDSEEVPGVMIQLMARSDFYDQFFGIIKAAADEWDGKTDPVRTMQMDAVHPNMQQ
jgi:hypothetical protein